MNYDFIDNNYIARRIVELATNKYTVKEISEIIGSERSLERVFLNDDVKSFVEEFIEDGILYESNGKICLNGEKGLILKDHFKSTENRGITRILWDITRKCNLRCQHCYAFKEGGYSEELTLEQMYKTIDDLKKIQPYLIVYGGGEPFVRKDFLKILKKTKEALNCRIKILTNGTLLTPSLLQEIKPYVDFVQISLDGKAENHDRLRSIKGSFDSAVKAIKLVRQEGMQAGICMTINKFNVKDIDWVINFALEQQVYKLRISPFVASGKAVNTYKDWIIPQDEMISLYKKLADYRIKYRDKILFDFRDELYGNAFLGCTGDKLDGNNEYMLCAAGKSLFYINPEGYVTPCNFIDTCEYYVGNVKKDDVAALWKDNKLFNSFRALRIKDIEKCSECERKSLCGGGLRCNSLMTTGKLNKVDPLCVFFKSESKNKLENEKKGVFV